MNTQRPKADPGIQRFRPFLLLSTRPEDDAAEGEREAVARFGGLRPGELVQFRVEQETLPALRLREYSGIILGGGPFNASDDVKSDLQLRVEADLGRVLDEVLRDDIPFLGLCYGVGTVTTHLGGTVDTTFGEPVGAIDVDVTPEGLRDPLLAGSPAVLRAFVGHKEAVASLPERAVLLASGSACPVQMFRVGDNCYVTQFHPELDGPGIGARIQIYRNFGYFAPEETDRLVEDTSREEISPEVHAIIRRFVDRYATQSR